MRSPQFQLLAFCLWSTVAASAETISLVPSADTCLFELDPTYNLGGQRDLPSGTLGGQVGSKRSRALYKFDISSALPATAEITAARLNIDVTRSPEGRRNSTFALHRVLFDWGEGTKRGDNPGGDEAEPGEATWQARFHPDQPWSVPGGALGSDFATAAAAERSILGNGSYTFEFNETGLADVRAAVTNPSTNFGWLLVSQSEENQKTARRWASREHRTTPPVLEIDFTVAEPIPLPALSVVGLPQAPTLQFEAHPSAIYNVFKSLNLVEWASLATVGPFEVIQIVDVPDPSPGIRAFYRVSVVDSSELNQQ